MDKLNAGEKNLKEFITQCNTMTREEKRAKYLFDVSYAGTKLPWTYDMAYRMLHYDADAVELEFKKRPQLKL